jgi:magnesium-transporting ATPase (P-type)
MLSVPLVVQCMDMLLQRRDWLLNWAMFLIVIVLALCSLGVEMIQTSFEYAAAGKELSTASNGAAVDRGDQCKQAFTCEDVTNFHRKKNMVIRIIMACIGVVVLACCTCTFPAFPSTPFSNAYSSLLLVMFLLTMPLISSARHITQVLLPILPLAWWSHRVRDKLEIIESLMLPAICSCSTLDQ